MRTRQTHKIGGVANAIHSGRRGGASMIIYVGEFRKTIPRCPYLTYCSMKYGFNLQLSYTNDDIANELLYVTDFVKYDWVLD